jgi:hypothetical protein
MHHIIAANHFAGWRQSDSFRFSALWPANDFLTHEANAAKNGSFDPTEVAEYLAWFRGSVRAEF